MVPLFIFSVVMIYLFAQNERATFQRSATQRTLALLTAVDAELKAARAGEAVAGLVRRSARWPFG